MHVRLSAAVWFPWLWTQWNTGAICQLKIQPEDIYTSERLQVPNSTACGDAVPPEELGEMNATLMKIELSTGLHVNSEPIYFGGEPFSSS